MTNTPPGGNPGSGTLAGTVHFVGTACQDPKKGPPCDGPYPNYEVVVYKEDGTTVAGKTTTGADGKFSVNLPEGKYVILTEGGGVKPGEKTRVEVSVGRDALQNVELRIDTGVRAESAPR